MTSDSGTGPLLGGRFEVGELLGVGGSAAVFVALDRTTGEQVAVKIGHAHVGAGTLADFSREAEAAQRLDHPNVARVHAHGWHDSAGLVQPWMAMDLVPGPSLAAWVAEHGPLAPGAAAQAIGQVLDALAAAHAIGLVHRDVAPDNVLLDAGGRLRLVDFGLAAAMGSTATVEGVDGKVVGHVHYMSPEQASGLPIGPAGDVYQAGALLHFLLTGRPPYVRDRVADVLRAHVEAPVPVPSARDPRNRPFDRIVATALAKQPAQRFASADEMAAAVTRAAVPTATAAEAAPTTAAPAFATATPGQGPVDEDAFREGGFGGIGWLVGAALALVVALVWGLTATDTPVALATGDGPDPSSTPSALPLETVAAEPVEVAVDDRVAVPLLDGSLGEVESRLRAAGLVIGAVSRVSSAEVSGTVLDGSRVAGDRVAPGSSVDLQVASGSNVVPDVVGRTPGEARALVEAAGFVPVVIESSRPDAGAPTVAGTQPGTGTVLRLGVSVTVEVVVAAAAPEPAEGGAR